jgi:hypothetical protein
MQQNYAVMFNLDVSGSMSGSKWSSVCQSVARFNNFLGENDIIAAMVFNHEAKLLSTMSQNDELFKRQPVYRPPSPVNHYPVRTYTNNANNGNAIKKEKS